MSVTIPIQDRLFTREYKRCRFPVDNAFSPGDRVMAAVPGGVVFVSRRGFVYPGKRTLMFCRDTSPSTAEDLFGNQLCCNDLISIAFTGSMLVIVAEGSLDHPERGIHNDERGVWCFSWSDLSDGRVLPIHMFSIPKGVVDWGSVAGACDNFAFLCDGTLTTSGAKLAKAGHDRLRTKVPIEGIPILAVSADYPEMIAITGDKLLAVARFDSPRGLQDSISKLEMDPTCLEISDTGQMIALGYRTGLVEIRDTHDFAKPVMAIIDLGQACTALAFSGHSSDRLFAASSNTGEILVVDTRAFTGHQKFWLPAIPRPSESLSRYDLRDALWPNSEDLYELPASRPEDYIATLSVSDMVWLENDGGVLAIGTNEGILFIQCGRRTFIKSLELM